MFFFIGKDFFVKLFLLMLYFLDVIVLLIGISFLVLIVSNVLIFIFLMCIFILLLRSVVF